MIMSANPEEMKKLLSRRPNPALEELHELLLAYHKCKVGAEKVTVKTCAGVATFTMEKGRVTVSIE